MGVVQLRDVASICASEGLISDFLLYEDGASSGEQLKPILDREQRGEDTVFQLPALKHPHVF
jgi:hypothetical protein